MDLCTFFNHELLSESSIESKSINIALDAFARYDTESAMQVVRGDKQIDQAYKAAVRDMMTYMSEDTNHIARAMNILWALRSLERIGDHARNIAEQVIYLVHGEDIRHSSIADIEKTLQERRIARSI